MTQQNHDRIAELAKEVEELNRKVASMHAGLQKPGPKHVTSREQACACDWTAYCPVHSKNGQRAYNFDPNSYIAGGS